MALGLFWVEGLKSIAIGFSKVLSDLGPKLQA